MEIIPDKRKMSRLVEQAAVGELCLPNFQRDFVWRRDEVADLIRSILRGYFIGSLLLLRSDPDRPPFAPQLLRGAGPVYPIRPKVLVLDGQQRLTSLLYALTAPDLGLKNSKKRRFYFVDLDRLTSDPDDDEIVFDRTAADAKRDGIDTAEGQWRRHVLPCTALLTDGAFMSWRDGIDDWLATTSPDDHQLFRSTWRNAWAEAVHRFQGFEAPVVELPQVAEDDHDAIARVCAIFEKLNSTGVELSVYDLLTARLYRSQIDLHKLWAEAITANVRLAEWSGGRADTHSFGVLVLRVLALLRDLEPKPKTLINLEPKDFETDWRRAARAMDRALELVELVGTDGFGVFREKWLPGYGLLPVLAALRAHIEDRGLGAEPRSDLRRWYWCSVFLNRYSSAVETKSRRDFSELTRMWAGEDVRPVVFADAEARIGASGYSIRESASSASAIYSGVFCMLALRGARDWMLGESIELQRLEDHHIFPQDYLKSMSGSGTTINSVVNRTLISASTNKKISNKAPADYLENPEVFPTPPRPLLEPHFVDASALDGMRAAGPGLGATAKRAVFEKFAAAREAVIVNHIRELSGVASIHVGPPAEGDDEDIETDPISGF